MSNPYFRFKQFIIYHDRCAMKVGTDGVLLGSWLKWPQLEGKNQIKNNNALDIGSGSGLISLMLAQRFPSAQVTGIEVEPHCFEQSLENVAASPFAERTEILHSSIQEFAENTDTKFDLIVSNPPFFQGAHTSGNEKRDLARHNHLLRPAELWQSIQILAHKQSKFAVILPTEEGVAFVKLGKEQNWYLERICEVRGQPKAKVKRFLMEFSQDNTQTQKESLILETSRGVYTTDYARLAKDFYLKL